MKISTNDCLILRIAAVTGVAVLCVSGTAPVTYGAGKSEEIPDFSGTYTHRHGKASRGGEGLYVTDIKPTPESLAIMEAWNPADDFVIQCEPPGLKRQILHPYPMKMTQSADTIEFWYEGWEAERTVHIDGTFPGEIKPGKLGYSIGHFEGQDLVIETIGHTGGFISEVSGLQFSKDAIITERYTRFEDPADNHIVLQLTIDDPQRLEEPMIIADAWTWDPTVVLLDYKCLIPEHHGIGR